MGKELPYFKFITSEWLDGEITVETLEAQGLFIKTARTPIDKNCFSCFSIWTGKGSNR